MTVRIAMLLNYRTVNMFKMDLFKMKRQQGMSLKGHETFTEAPMTCTETQQGKYGSFSSELLSCFLNICVSFHFLNSAVLNKWRLQALIKCQNQQWSYGANLAELSWQRL